MNGSQAKWRAKLRAATRFTLHKVRRDIVSPLLPRAPVRAPPAARDVMVCGVLNSSSGLGKSARLCLEEMRRLGLRAYAKDVSDDYGLNEGILGDPGPGAPAAFEGTKIWHLNPPMLGPTVLRHAPLKFFDTYNIGYWAWEFDIIPDDWVFTARMMDAIFVTSNFTAGALHKRTTTPIAVVHHPVNPIVSDRKWRSELGLRADDFVVHLSFNYGSSFDRKNPGAAVAAFLQAFPDEKRAHLVVKCSERSAHRGEHATMEALRKGCDRIVFVDELLNDHDANALIACADALISLHRSEGFGLPIAEAMNLGVPVVATNWSGNTDFCTPRSCLLVDAQLVPVHVRHAHIDGLKGGLWAEPNIACASAHLRHLFDSQRLRERLASCAREEIARTREHYSYARALAQCAAIERQDRPREATC